MAWIIFFCGIIISGICLATILFPVISRNIIKFFSVGNRLYSAGIIRIILGTMILLLSAQAKLWWFTVTIGLLAACSGAVLFFSPLRRAKELLARIQNKPDNLLRIYTSLTLLVWLILLYSLLPAL
ncbi:MAG: hypothetical protein V1662_03105 [Candidatus Omnitrophota bacterium]